MFLVILGADLFAWAGPWERTNGRAGRDESCPSAYFGHSFAALATGRTLISNFLIFSYREKKTTFRV